MTEYLLFRICIIVAIFGVVSIVSVYIAGKNVIKNRLSGYFDFRYFDKLFHKWYTDNKFDDIPNQLVNAYSNYLERRNEFWTTYGQVVIALVMIIVLCVLLLTKTISAEAGLPILSAISGFAIAKGVSGSKSVNLPNKKNGENNEK